MFLSLQMLVRNPPARVVSAAYVGPGDVVSGAYAWYGLRGYNAAYATGSNPALDLVDQAGANPLTANILANGSLDVASINTWVTAHSVSTIKVKRMYDQSGNTRHINQATLGNMPVLNLTGFGSLPAVVFTAASSHSLASSATTASGPITQSIVFNKASASNGQEMSGVGAENFLFTNNAANRFTIWTGSASTPNVTVSDATWHAVQAVVNAGSSNIYADGSGNASTASTTGGWTSRTLFLGGPPSVSNYFGGSVAEFGMWQTAFSGTNATDMNTNQHGSNGYNF